MKLKNNLSEQAFVQEYRDKGIFNEHQLLQIYFGVKLGQDVSIYAKPEFTWRQMDQISHGLDYGIDVSKYADTRYSWQQMQAIKYALIGGVDVTPYIEFDTDPNTINLFAKSLRLEKQS